MTVANYSCPAIAKALLFMGSQKTCYFRFNSLSQFNRAFRKVVGRTPTEYRSDLRVNVVGLLPEE